MPTQTCAHRGAPDTHPENTLASFREALRLGVAMIEFDVQLTQDGHAVVLHDPTVDRTTNGTGAVEARTLEELRALDAGSRQGASLAGEKIPLLRETLTMMPPGVLLNVHLKPGEEVARVALREIVDTGRVEQSVLACDIAAAEVARKLCPELRICNMERQEEEDYVDLTLRLGTPFIQLLHPQATRENVARLHAQGVTVNCFYANDEAEMRRQINIGVDYILTDHPALLMALLAAAV